MILNTKQRACIFIHYSKSSMLPYNVQLYIEELSRHFQSVSVLTNNALICSKKYLFAPGVKLHYLENKGYDFGMFYRYISTQNINNYKELAIINDSNLIINHLNDVFNWGRKKNVDFWGIIDSHEKPWFSEHSENHHIQSHFLVFNERAIKMLPSYFDKMDIEFILRETNLKKLRRKVINDWEIGLSRYLISQKLSFASFFSNKKMQQKYSSEVKNMAHDMHYELAAEGYPLLKKKVTQPQKKWYKLNAEKNEWEKTVLDFGNKEWNLHKIIAECY